MYETLYDFLHREPFKPFQIKVSNGKSHVVQRANWALLTKKSIFIAWPKKDRFVICDLPEIEAIEPVSKKRPKT
jgi:hypothetical protein